MMPALALTIVALGRRNPGLAHYLEWGSVLLLTILFVVVWSIRTWKNAPDPDERWRQAGQERGSTGTNEAIPPTDPKE
jgi:hypothetical protein